MTTLAMNSSPVPVYDAVAIRMAREASDTSAKAQPRSSTATSPAHPQPYSLQQGSSPSGPPRPNLRHATPSISSPAVSAPAQSAAAPPSVIAAVASPILKVKEETLIDPELLALDRIPTCSPQSSDKAAQQLSFTQPLNIPFQAPLFDIPSTSSPATGTVLPALATHSSPTEPSGAELLNRAHLTLQTALDPQKFSTFSAAPSSTTSYAANSIFGTGIDTGTGPNSSQDTSPFTPTDADGSEYDPGLSSPVHGDAGSEYGGVPAPKVRPKKSHARKQPEGHVKRARNAFILFRKHITDSNLIPPSVEVKHQNISVVAAKMWKEVPQDVRAKFQEMARLEKEEHQRKYPNYRYQPVFRRTDIIRRRVRKDGAEDEKVEAVAEALIKGKAGGELEKEIKEQALVDENVDNSPEGSAARSRSRRRRDPGQLSKGAIRAQEALNRQKAMRANLLGHNLLNMSLFNAQQQQQQRAEAMAAQGHSGPDSPSFYGHSGHYGHGDYSPAPVGYDLDGRGLVDVYGNPVPAGPYDAYGDAGVPYGHGHGAHGDYPEDMYHLPSMAGYDDRAGYDAAVMDPYYPPHPHSHGMEYDGMDQPSPYGHSHGMPYSHDPRAQHDDGYMQGYDMDNIDNYRLPPLLHQVSSPLEPVGPAGARGASGMSSMPTSAIPGGGGGLHARVEDDEDDQGEDPRMMRGWGMRGAADQHQTPSGHVVFNEGLFEGELGMGMGIGMTMGLGAAGSKEADGLGDFEDAVQQANEMW